MPSIITSALCVGGGTVWFGLRPDVELALRSPTFLLLAGLTLALSAFSALSAFTMSVPDRTRLWYFAVPMGIVALELSVLAHVTVPIIERYYLVIAVLLKSGSGRISQDVLESQCQLMAQRMSLFSEL